MQTIAESWIDVGTLDELQRRGVMVTTSGDRPVAVFFHEGKVSAVDNRCPHLGFPLHQGTVKDGLLTCHWHEARFDLCNGCTFDLWADDVPAYDTEVRDGHVYVARRPRHPQDRGYHSARLKHGLRHGVSLIQGKAILGLRSTGAGWSEILAEVAAFGTQHHDRWGEGMTLLSVVGNLLPMLSDETAYHAVLRASRQVANDCSEAVPHRVVGPLEDGDHSPEQLTRWMRHWIHGRHRDAAERVALTAVERLGNSPALAELVFTAASDRVYSQTGHVFDFANKAFELLDSIGWEHAASVFPLVLEQMAMGRGTEEDAHWHQPIDVIEPLREVEARLPQTLQAGSGRNGNRWTEDSNLLTTLLGDNPQAIVGALETALADGAPPTELSRRVAYAAALRLARFGKTNELADWFNPRHTFIFANAVHRALKRSSSPGIVRGLFHAALSVYMDRFLNVPPARLPDGPRVDELPDDADALCGRLLETLDRHGDFEESAGIVARYMRLGLPLLQLIDTLTLATIREDFDFHALQVLEAGVRQIAEWESGAECEHILIGVVRQLAAFCPTPRAGHQMAMIARRLQRGDKMYEEE